jgi:ATP-binding cassette, subfamily B (MDR/TAP), member 1
MSTAPPSPSPTDEKQGLKDVQKKRFSFNPKKSNNALDEKQDDASASTAVQPPPEFPPVPFTQLFRFSTVLDLSLNAVGLVCAAGAGAAQVRNISCDTLPPRTIPSTVD